MYCVCVVWCGVVWCVCVCVHACVCVCACACVCEASSFTGNYILTDTELVSVSAGQEMASSTDLGYETSSIISKSESSSSGASLLTKVRLRLVLHMLFIGSKFDFGMPKNLSIILCISGDCW